MFRIITEDLQSHYENYCISHNLADETNLICGYYGRGCRRMNDIEGANRVLCLDCALPKFTPPQKKYTIKSISEEGEYYLVNGWRKHKAYWVDKKKLKPDMLFSSVKRAKISLSHLLKIMEEYQSDTFEVVEFEI